MPIEFLLLLIVFVEAVWIISSLFRSKEEEQKRLPGRPMPREAVAPGAGGRGRPAPTNVDRFLEEMNRRRREAAGQEPPAADRPDKPQPDRPLRPPELPRRRVVIAEESATVPPPAAETVIRIPTVIAQAAPQLVTPVQIEVTTKRPTASSKSEPSRPSAADKVFIPSKVTLASQSIVGSEQAETSGTAARDRVLGHLQNPEMLRSAIYLQEVLGPPLCHRRR